MVNIPTPPLWLICGIGVFFGLYLARKAGEIGKSRKVWFFIGFLFGIYGLIAFWFVKRNSQKKPILVEVLPPPEPLIHYSDSFWYYLDEQQATIGPMSHTRLNQLFRDGILHAKTLVWNEGLESWKKLEEILKNPVP